MMIEQNQRFQDLANNLTEYFRNILLLNKGHDLRKECLQLRARIQDLLAAIYSQYTDNGNGVARRGQLIEIECFIHAMSMISLNIGGRQRPLFSVYSTYQIACKNLTVKGHSAYHRVASGRTFSSNTSANGKELITVQDEEIDGKMDISNKSNASRWLIHCPNHVVNALRHDYCSKCQCKDYRIVELPWLLLRYQYMSPGTMSEDTSIVKAITRPDEKHSLVVESSLGIMLYSLDGFVLFRSSHFIALGKHETFTENGKDIDSYEYNDLNGGKIIPVKENEGIDPFRKHTMNEVSMLVYICSF
jgi:hypothetical protein